MPEPACKGRLPCEMSNRAVTTLMRIQDWGFLVAGVGGILTAAAAIFGHLVGVRAMFPDGTEVGVLDGRRYRLLEVPPGKHSVAEGWSTAHQTVTLSTEGSKNYVGDDEGRNLVSQLELAGQWRSVAGVEHSH